MPNLLKCSCSSLHLSYGIKILVTNYRLRSDERFSSHLAFASACQSLDFAVNKIRPLACWAGPKHCKCSNRSSVFLLVDVSGKLEEHSLGAKSHNSVDHSLGESFCFFDGIVEVEGSSTRASQAQLGMQRHGTMMASSNSNPFSIQELP